MSDPVDLGYDRVARSRAGQRVRAGSQDTGASLLVWLRTWLSGSGASEPADPNLKLVLV